MVKPKIERDGETLVMTSSQMLDYVQGRPVQPTPPPKTLEDDLYQLSQRLDELSIKLEDIQELFNEFKYEMVEKMQELEQRVNDLEKYAEE